MEFFFADPNVERLPPADTRLLDLRAEPDPDGARIRVSLDITPFQQRPYIELTLTDSSGRELSSASIVEPVGWKLELTLHIRKVPMPIPETQAESKIEETYSKNMPYILSASLSYPELGQVDQRQITGLIRKQ
jgi:hypothetical protein